MKALAIMLLLTGCASLYYPHPEYTEGMRFTETHYTDAQKLAEVCGDAKACVFHVPNKVCDMHLPLAADGSVMYREHELSHCYGRIDSPNYKEL